MRIDLPRIGTWEAFRTAARGALSEGLPPEDVLWVFDGAPQADLFGDAPVPTGARSPVNVPKSFVSLAETVVWHADPERFARLYALLWRLRDRPALMADRSDPALARLREMEKGVRRCAHKMKAFVRFRDLAGDGPRRRFAAWFEPTHHTVEPTAPFFTRRFADMDWLIATPDVTARFEAGALSLGPGQARPDLPEDGAEELWGTYFCNIFNPARLKVQAMTSEMPRKYWKNLPEARHIPALIAGAESRVRAMAETAPTLPPVWAERAATRPAPVRAVPGTLAELRAMAAAEPPLPGRGRMVLGEGPAGAVLMVVGEQPGNEEDMAGRPFVGPAGQIFDRVAQGVGLDRGRAYVTNAVQRFKFRERGKRRLHQPPNRTEIEHGRWWLEAEIKLVRPRLILAMGATALHSLTGQRNGLMQRRGQVEDTPLGPVFVTVHPSFLLRLPDAARRAEEMALFTQDLAAVARLMDRRAE